MIHAATLLPRYVATPMLIRFTLIRHATMLADISDAAAMHYAPCYYARCFDCQLPLLPLFISIRHALRCLRAALLIRHVTLYA